MSGRFRKLTPAVLLTLVVTAYAMTPLVTSRAAPARASSEPASSRFSPAPGSYEVREWVIFVCEPMQPAANAPGLFQSTLPDFAASAKREGAAMKDRDR